MKGIYLGAFKAYHENRNIIYQDINGKRDLAGDMMEVDLTEYDYIIATPPCNYYSRANYRRETSVYSQKTKHLLPDIIDKLLKLNKPFIVENVRNDRIFDSINLLDKPCFIYKVGRHTYWTNVLLNINIVQNKSCNITNLSKNQRQGTKEVHDLVEIFLDTILA